ncbi:MAG TPA: DUF5522 domain-containing protein [Tepidisphaeraceae bacterium]|jgi:hypothetical protein
MARKRKLVLGKDYTLNENGRAVLSREYLLGRGECCGNDCASCPYPEAQRAGTEAVQAGTLKVLQPEPVCS